jgi:hypothetical protein
MRYLRAPEIRIAVITGWALSTAGLGSAQDALSNPLDTTTAQRGVASGAAESINPVDGTLRLSIPVAQFRPGPGDHPPGVNLSYSSGIYDITSGPPGTITPVLAWLTSTWQASTHGGGWEHS